MTSRTWIAQLFAALALAPGAMGQQVGSNVDVQGSGPNVRVDGSAYNNTPNGHADARSRTGPNGTAYGQAGALGWDNNGAYLSQSYGVRLPNGTVVAGTYNMGVGLDGQATVNGGSAVAQGPYQQGASAGGNVGWDRGTLGGRTDVRANSDRFGSARANAYGRHYPSGPRPMPYPMPRPRPRPYPGP